MPNSAGEIIIDLTKSFSSCESVNISVPHCEGFSTNLVIDLVSDALYEQSDYIPKKNSNKRQKPAEDTETGGAPDEKKSRGIGNCSICWNELGTQQLASTKCGHVFCLKCLEKSLKIKKQCPTCRCMLKGRTAYHPLYLTLS